MPFPTTSSSHSFIPCFSLSLPLISQTLIELFPSSFHILFVLISLICSNGVGKCSQFSREQVHFGHRCHWIPSKKYTHTHTHILPLNTLLLVITTFKEVCLYKRDVFFFFFLGAIAVFVEKVLRVQPNVKKLYLLLRASDAKSASQRLNNEVRILYTHT